MKKYYIFILLLLLSITAFGLNVSRVYAQQCTIDSDCAGSCPFVGECGGYPYIPVYNCIPIERDNGDGTCTTNYVCQEVKWQGTVITESKCEGFSCGQCRQGSEICTVVSSYSGPPLDYESAPYACGSTPTTSTTCQDPTASNYLGILPCIYTPGYFTLSVSPGTRSILNGESTIYTLTLNPTISPTTNLGDESAIGSYILPTPIPGCPVGASCSYSGGNIMSSTLDTTTSGVDYATSPQKTVLVTASTVIPSTYTLTFSATNVSNQIQSASANLIVGAGINNASCTSITAPASVTIGQNFNVTVTMQNNGSTVWTPSGANNYHLLVSPWSATPWSNARTPVVSNIAPGGSYTFTLPVTAPATAGTYTLGTQMLQENVQWFGALCNNSGNITVTGTPAPVVEMTGWGGTVTQASANNGPITMAIGGTGGLVWITSNATSCQIFRDGTLVGNYPVNGSAGVGPMTVTNTHSIVCTGPGGTSNTDSVIHQVPPTVSLSASPTTGASPLSTTLSWSTGNSPTSCTAGGGWSGSKVPVGGGQAISGIITGTTYTLFCTNAAGNSTTASVTVTPVGAISVSISANPASMTLPTNSTTLTWTTTGSPTSCTASNYWSGSKSALAGPNTEVRSGMTAQTYTFVITCSKAGVPDTTASVSVPVSTIPLVNNASCTSITAPNTVTAGATFAATIVMQNTGTKTWDNIYTSAADQEHKLTSWNPPVNIRWGVSHMLLPGGTAIPPGNSVTFTRNFTAPNTPGTYPFDFSMLEENVEWFGTPCAKNGGVIVTAPTTTGTLLPASPTCTIASGASSCTVNLTWSTANPVGTSAITAVGMANVNGNSGTNVTFSVPYNARIFYLYNNAILLATSNATASCVGGTSWNGTVCTSAVATSCPSGNAYVASKTLGTIRNDYSGWVGAQIQIGASPRTVTALGRIRVGTNTGNHTVKLVNQSNGTDVAGGSVSINMSSGTAGEYVYGVLASPITLSANTSYYVVSQEVNGGDQWYNDTDTQIFPTSVGTIPGAVYGNGSWNFNGTANRSYVPIDLCTTPVVAQASFSLNPTTMSFAGTYGGATPNAQTLQIVSNGTIDVWYTATSNQGWCQINGAASVLGAVGSSPPGQFSPVNITVASPGTMSVGPNTCLITVNDPNASPTSQVLTVTYNVAAGAVTQYNLTINKTIGGSVNSGNLVGTVFTPDGLVLCGATCIKAYNQGSIVTLQAVPDTVQWRFVGWGGGSCSGTGYCSLTIDGNKTVTAQFRPRALLYQEF